MNLLLKLPATPDFALCAVIAGILLLYAECNLPGTVLPGCLGTFSLMLGVFGLSRMPIRLDAAGLALAGLAAILLAIFRSRPRLLAALGVAALAAGFLRLVDAARYGKPVHLPTALLGAFLLGATTLCLGRIALLARRGKRIAPRDRPTPGVD